MKKLIKEVLNDLKHSQINLESKSAREMIANLVSAALKAKGSYKEYTDYEIDEQKASASWVCTICGKSTYELDYDYVGSGANHLSCEVRLEQDEKYREKNWSQKKHENKVFNSIPGCATRPSHGGYPDNNYFWNREREEKINSYFTADVPDERDLDEK